MSMLQAGSGAGSGLEIGSDPIMISIIGSDPISKATWYLLQVKTQQHQRAEENLAQQGFTFFAPSHRVKKIYRRQLITRRLGLLHFRMV